MKREGHKAFVEKTQFGVYCQESNFVAIDCGAPSPHEKQTENRGNRLNTVLCWLAKICYLELKLAARGHR